MAVPPTRLTLCSVLRLCPQKCSEEKVEILQGKISLLEDQLAKLGDCSTQEKGEVMGDILKVRQGGAQERLWLLQAALGWKILAEGTQAKPCGAEPAALCAWVGAERSVGDPLVPNFGDTAPR